MVLVLTVKEEKNMIRLIISDIDGTLLPEGSTCINPEYMKVVRALTDRGVQFAAASGRQASSIDSVFRDVKDCIYYLADNGACIERCGVPVKEVHLNPADTAALIEEVRGVPGCCALLSTAKGFYTEEKNPEFHHLIFDKYKGKGGVVEDAREYADMCVKLSLYCWDNARPVYEHFYERWKDRFSINISGYQWVDFNDFSSSKGNAVRWIQEELGIGREETVAFGDNFNDISMFEQAGQSYASVLSHPDVKRAARYEVPSYEEDGVLQVLKRILGELEHEK